MKLLIVKVRKTASGYGRDYPRIEDNRALIPVDHEREVIVEVIDCAAAFEIEEVS